MRLSRRQFVRLGITLPGTALLSAALGRARAMAGDSGDRVETGPPQPRYLIVNADDFGMSRGINRGIIEAHARGIVTSASLLVTSRAAEDAVRLARRSPALSIGLHVDLLTGLPVAIDLSNLNAVEEELERQIALFRRLVGRLPTHIDSHHHVHLRFNVGSVFLEASEHYGLPLRGFSPVVYVGGFYGQWPPGTSHPERISADALIGLVAAVGPGMTEIGCHPGYFDRNVRDSYGRLREVELRSLTDRRVRRAVEKEGIKLVSYQDYSRLGPKAGGRGWRESASRS